MKELEGPLDEDVRALLRGAKDVPELAETTKDRLFAEVTARVALPPPDGGGSDGTGGAAPAGGAASAPPTGLSLVGGKAVGALVGTFAIGLAAGIAVDRGIASPVPPAPVVSVATSVAPTSAPPAVSAAEPSPVPVTALPSAAAAVPPAASPRASVTSATSSVATATPSARGLAAERALLDVARGALARGEAQEAFDAAQRHAAEYPSGSLVEEREALAIKALVALGWRDEARARAQEMERRFPNGLMLRAVKAAVETPAER